MSPRDGDPLRRSRALEEMLELARMVIADGLVTDAEAEVLERWIERNQDMIGSGP